MPRNPVPRHIHGEILVDDWADVYLGTCKLITSTETLVRANWQDGSESFDTTQLVDCCDYLYVAAWSNFAGFNGLVVELTGDTTVTTNQNDWEVYATGNAVSQNGVRFDRDVRPTIYDINRGLAEACKGGWATPAELSGDIHDTMGIAGSWIWFDSGNHATPSNFPIPFDGFDHDELLIFRLPLNRLFVDGCQGEPPCEECDCGCGDGCNGCIENADRKNDDLIDRADQQFNDVEAIENPAMGSDPFSSECEVVLPDDFSLRPYFYLHWGKSAGDRIENHDTEVLYITVKNIFEDLEFRGFKVASLGFDPSPSLRDHARIVPDCFVDYGCIPPCSSITREFALITRNRGEYIGPVHLTLDYCYDDLVVSDPRAIGGTASFELEIIDDD